MAIVRIFQIAKELNISHTDIVDFLNKKGLDVKSHMSPVDDEVRNLIMSEFSKDKMLVDRFRKDRIKSLGNSIVPQIARELGKAIIEAENVSDSNLNGHKWR